MDLLRHLDDRLLLDINALARVTGWLHAPARVYASYGVLLFAVLLLAEVLAALPRRRASSPPGGGRAWPLRCAVNQPVATRPAPAGPGPPRAGSTLRVAVSRTMR